MKKKIDFKDIIIVVLSFIVMIEAFMIGSSPKENNESVNQIDIALHAETFNEINELKGHGKPLMVVFGADYCPACINYQPYLKEIADIYADDITIKFVDTVECEAIRDDYNIELIPSTIIFDKDGHPYQPSKELSAIKSDEVIDERQYISSEYEIAQEGTFDYNDQFEYGLDQNNHHAYSKFVGLLDMIQLEEMILDLIKE